VFLSRAVEKREREEQQNSAEKRPKQTLFADDREIEREGEREDMKMTKEGR
jgi:hypothetical protein